MSIETEIAVLKTLRDAEEDSISVRYHNALTKIQRRCEHRWEYTGETYHGTPALFYTCTRCEHHVTVSDKTELKTKGL